MADAFDPNDTWMPDPSIALQELAGRPSPARAYDYWLGGKDYHERDKVLGDLIVKRYPQTRNMVRQNRAFMQRVVRALAGVYGVQQFLDLGTGIPTSPNVHEVAQEIDPAARVVYCDNDPTVITHARALLRSGHEFGRTSFVYGDLARPRTILEAPELQQTLDLGQPVAVLAMSVLMYWSDDQNPYGMVAQVMEAMPPGSFLALSHQCTDFDPETIAAFEKEMSRDGAIPMFGRTRENIARFFNGLEMAWPGLVEMLEWPPGHGKTLLPADQEKVWYLVGVGRKV